MTVQRIFSRNLCVRCVGGRAAPSRVPERASRRRRFSSRAAQRCNCRRALRGNQVCGRGDAYGILRSGITTSGNSPMTGLTKWRKRMVACGFRRPRAVSGYRCGWSCLSACLASVAAVVALGASRSPRAGALLLRRCYSAARLAVLLRRRGGRTAAITLDGEVQADGDGTTPAAQTLPVTSGRVAGPVDGCRAQNNTVSSQ